MGEIENKIQAVEEGLESTTSAIKAIEEKMLGIGEGLEAATKFMKRQEEEIEKAFAKIEKQSIEITRLRNKQWQKKTSQGRSTN